MKITCPKCGAIIVVSGLGRKSLRKPLIIVCDELRLCRSVGETAKNLVCSPAYIYKVLKENGLTAKEVINGKGGK